MSSRLLVLSIAPLLVVGQLSAQDAAEKPVKPDKPATAAPAKPPTVKVEKGPFKVEIALKGIFEAADMIEVSLGNLQAWTPQTGGQLIVKKALDHGTAVRKGEPIIWLDLEKIDRTIADLENDLKQQAVAIQLAEEELPILEQALPLDLAVSERAKKVADEDLKRWLDYDRSWAEKNIHFMVKRYQQSLEYAKEELRQLTKMYKSKDLTEETEEIILRRQRNYVEMIEYYLKEAEYERDVAIKTLLPRREQVLKDSAAKLGLDVHRARVLLPLTLNQKRLALQRMKYEHDKQTSRLAKLRHDRDAMTVTAPSDGLIYHGKCVRGQWQGSPDRLQPGAMLQGHEVLVTIVKTRPIFVRAVVDEKDLRHLRAGLTGKVVPSAFPDLRLPAKVVRVSPIPISSEKFDVHVSVDVGKDDLLVPGMSAAVKVVPYLNQNALTVPSSAVFTDEIDDDQHYVYVPGKGGKAEKRSVTLGFKDGTRQEIRTGLKEGEEILKEKPDDGAKAGTTRGGKS